MRYMLTQLVLVLAVADSATLADGATETPYEIEWIRDVDHGYYPRISADGAGNVFLAGNTKSSLGGQNAGDSDFFLFKYDSSGDLLWKRQLGSNRYDGCGDVSADSLGNVFFCGNTQGNLAGPFGGTWDGYLGKYDTSLDSHRGELA